MSFNPQYKYLNKFFVVGTVTEIQPQKRQDESVFGVQFTVNTGSPSGIARVRLLNGKHVPDALAATQQDFAGGTPRIAFGLGSDWLRFGEREGNNGRTYRDFTQFQYPRLALQSEQDRAAGKLVGTMTSKQIVDDHYVIVVEVYETNRDGSVQIDNQGNERVSHFTLIARGEQANEIHNAPEGSNVECSVRLYNEVVRDDFGDVVDSSNEARVEKFKVLAAASSAPQFGGGFATGNVVPQFGGAQPTAPTFGTQPPVGIQTTPLTTSPALNNNPFGGGGLPVPFPGVGQPNPFGGTQG